MGPELSAGCTAVLGALADSTVTCGAGRLICIDGLSAAGKTTIAEELRAELTAAGVTVRVLHTDAMLHGWDGLPGLGATLRELVGDLAAGRPGRWRAWDWHSSSWGRWHPEPPLRAGEVVVLEGVGAGAGVHREHAAVQVWSQIDPDQQHERWCRRGDDLTRLPAWQRAEAALHHVWATREHADLVLTGGAPRGQALGGQALRGEALSPDGPGGR